MLRFTDPTVVAQAPLVQESPDDAANRRRQRWHILSAQLEHLRVKPLRDKSGASTTLSEMKAEHERSQEQNRVANERKLKERLERLKRMAAAKGWPNQIGDSVLAGESNGIPFYYGSDGVPAARTISADEIWPSGSFTSSINGDLATSIPGTFGLTGFGSTIAMWEPGAVYTDHDELIGRVTVLHQDTANPQPIGRHPTAVAGVLVGSGSKSWGNLANWARGIAYEADLIAYDNSVPLATTDELADITDDDVFISNHSYSRRAGWHETAPFTWIWYGDVDSVTNPALCNCDESTTFGMYGQQESERDQVLYDELIHLPVFSAGNKRGVAPTTQPISHWMYHDNGTLELKVGTSITHEVNGGADGFDSLPATACAKNVLTIGNVDHVNGGFGNNSVVTIAHDSGFGPTDDGRVKPDLVAQGQNVWSLDSQSTDDYAYWDGSSFSAPGVSGSLVLLRQLYHAHYPELTNGPILASTLKAIAIHTADDIDNPGPDYSSGWGLFNALTAAQLVEADGVGNRHSHIKELVLVDGEAQAGSDTFTGDVIEVPIKCDGTQPLRVTICWNDPGGPAEALERPENEDNTTLRLVNDLDLRLVSSSGAVFHPWVLDPVTPGGSAGSGDNIRDNVEQILLQNPIAGSCTLSITSKRRIRDDNSATPPSTPLSQLVSLIVTGNVPNEIKNEIVLCESNAGENQVCWSAWLGSVYNFETSTDLENWTPETNPSGSLLELYPVKPFPMHTISAPAGSTEFYIRVRRLR
ncbi:MAG: S8 family serine peptidase [Verrucomicrobiales bacterium]